MYAVSLLFRNSGTTQSFYFKAFKNADDFYRKASDVSANLIEVHDDFESRGWFDRKELMGVSFTDIEKEMDKQGQMQIIQAKATLRAQNLANNDAGLKLLNQTAASNIVRPN